MRSWERCSGRCAAAPSDGSAELTLLDDGLAEREPTLAQLAAAAVSGLVPAGPELRQRPAIALRGQLGVEVAAPPCVTELGFSLHAATRVGASDERGREALVRYALRPPFAQERLQLLESGLVRIELRRLSDRTDDAEREWLRVRALSFELERWYTAVEACIERVVRQLDGTAPAGRNWHEELLRSAGVAVAGLRPAVVSHEAAEALREVMRFRHFTRHGYDRDPDAERVDELARVALAAHQACEVSLREL